MSGFVGIWPVDFNLSAYESLINGTKIVSAFTNSVYITVVGVTLCMLFTVIAAYPLSRKYFYARKFFTLAIVFTMLFGGGLIPTYLTIKALGIIDSYWAIWLPGLVSAYNMLILKSFFENMPEELDEAARIDGCGEIRILRQIVLPLSMPVMAALSLFYGVGFWNSFMNVLIYINDTEKYNLPVLVQQMISSQKILQEMQNLQPEDFLLVTPESVKSAGIIVMIVPMLVVYPLLQKHFVKGVMIGSIKG